MFYLSRFLINVVFSFNFTNCGPQKFYLGQISLHAPVTKTCQSLHIIYVYFNFAPDQASKVYLHIINECTL